MSNSIIEAQHDYSYSRSYLAGMLDMDWEDRNDGIFWSDFSTGKLSEFSLSDKLRKERVKYLDKEDIEGLGWLFKSKHNATNYPEDKKELGDNVLNFTLKYANLSYNIEKNLLL